MNSYIKIISKRCFYIFLIITIGILLFLSLESCKPKADPEINGAFVEKKSAFISFSESTLELIDINGGDLYPGETVRANIEVVNSGADDTNIEVKLIIDDLLLADPGSASFVIDSLEAGQSIEHSIFLKVVEELPRDTPISALLSINEGKDSEFISNEEKLLAFGVHPYDRGKLPIIGLHAIEDEIEIPIELYTHHFNVLCQTLKSFGFETITFKDLLDHIDYGRVLPRKSVIITSDDGFKDLYTNAFPILKKLSVPAAIFIVTNFVNSTKVFWFDEVLLLLLKAVEQGNSLTEKDIVSDTDIRMDNFWNIYYQLVEKMKRIPQDEKDLIINKLRDITTLNVSEISDDFKMLTWMQVHEMDRSGLIEFGVHTANHRILQELKSDELYSEIQQPREKLSKVLNKPIDSFCYPNGRPSVDFNNSHIKYLKQCGYVCAFSTESGLIKQNSEDNFRIKRISVGNDLTSNPNFFMLNTSGFFYFFK